MNLVGRGRAGTQSQRGRGFSCGGGGLNSVTENENILSNDNDQLNIGTGLIALLLGQGRGRGSLHGRGGRGRGGLHNSAADAPVTDESELGPQGNLDNAVDGPPVFGLATASGGRGRGGRGMMRGGCGVQFGRGGLHSGADVPVNAPEERGPRDNINIDHGVDEPPTFLASASSGRGRGMRGPPGPFGTFGRGGAQLGGNAGAGGQQQQHTAGQQQLHEAGQQQQQHGAGQQQQHAAGSGTGNQQQQHEAGQQQQQYAAGQQQQHTAGTGNQQQQYAAGAGQQHTTGTGTGNQQRQYDENNNRESRSNNSQQEPEYDRWHNSVRRSYMPPEKTTLELFDEDIHIQRGPRFEEQFGHQHDNEIIVTCDGREIQQSHRSIETFHGFNLSQEIMNSIQIRNYETPTPIQKAVIPLIMSHGDDIMANAQTGSGKTAAFLLPIVHNLQIIVRQETRDDNLRRIRSSNYAPKPKCIVMVPAKELAEQIYEEARIFAENTGVSVARSYGDMQMYRSMLSIKLGCDILVATSGRLMHHIKANHINLSGLRYFVLDEADKLIEERHFCEAVNLTIEKSALHTNNPTRDPHAVHCRVMLFSATFNEGVQQLAQQILLGGYFFVRIGEMNRAVEIIEQTFIEVRPRQKQEQLLAILSEGAVRMEETSAANGKITYLEPAMKTIVFVEGRRFAVLLTATLAERGFRVAKLTSDCPLERRLKVREHFLRGNVKLVVATNLMSRGLNFPKVEHVINYDLPNYEPDSFIHRVGRTGRAGNLGQATSFFDPGSEADRNNAAFYVKVLNAAKQQVPDFLRLCAAQAFDFSEYDLPGDFQEPSAAGLPSGWDNRSDDNWAQRDRNNMMDAANAPTTSSHNPPSSSTVDNSGGNDLSSPISSDDANSQRDNINSKDTTDVIESSDDTIGLSDIVPSDDDIGLSDGDFIGPADDDTIELSLSDIDTIVADDDAIGLTDEDEESIVAPDAEHCAARFNEIRDQLLGTPLQRQ